MPAKSILVEWDEDGNVVDLHAGDDASSIEIGDEQITLEPVSYVEAMADAWGKCSDDRSDRLFHKFYKISGE